MPMIKRPSGRQPTERHPILRVLFLFIFFVMVAGTPSGCHLTAPEAPDPPSAGPSPDPEPNPKPDPALDFEPPPELQDVLRPVHPDEPVHYTLHERFGPANAAVRLEQIREVGSEVMEDFEGQLAMANWTLAVEGALLKQHYEIARLRLELNRCQYAAGDSSRDELESAQAAYEEARESFIQFWNDFSIHD